MKPMNNQTLKQWAQHQLRHQVSNQLSPRAQEDVLKTAALTETLLGYFRGYRDEVFTMEFDFDTPLQALPLNRGQKKKVRELLTAQVRGLLQNFLAFEQVLSQQLQMVEALPAQKQEVLHELDETIYTEMQKAAWEAAS
jgi:hypothetical protein